MRRNLHRQVVDELGLQIVRGDFKTGDTLPNEADLSSKLGVSRTVTREAIKVLGEKGLIESRPKVGTQILPRHKWNLLDPDVLNWEYEAGPRDQFLRKLTEVRLIIEPTAARLAASRASDEEIAAIQAAFQSLSQSVDDIDDYIPSDMVFHATIVRASHNELLEQIVNTIRAALISSRKVSTQIPNGAQASLPLHYAVVEAITQRDGNAAYTQMELLINSAQADIDRVLSLTSEKCK